MVDLVGLSTEQRFQLCVAVVNVVGQRWSSGLQHSAKSFRCSAAGLKNTGSASGCVSGIGSNRAYSTTFVRKPEGLDIVLWL